jgi:hypothetical protein
MIANPNPVTRINKAAQKMPLAGMAAARRADKSVVYFVVEDWMCCTSFLRN